MRELVTLFLLLAAPAVARAEAQPAPPAREPDAIVQTLFLIGDAGRPAKGGEPVLIALRQQVEHTSAPATVAFLGDNLYPSGLPAADDPEFAEAARRIDALVDSVKDTSARVVFIPGNHDWARGGSDGWAALRRQEERVERRGGPTVSFLPRGGCPGPELVDAGDRLRLVVLDTQWWLHRHARPQGSGSGCSAATEPEVVAALRTGLETAGGRDVVVLAHHPLQTGGPHGGQFGFREHVFPLTEWKKGFYLPLPIVGSIYPLARNSGASTQDVSNGRYRRMRESLAGAMRGHMPLAWVGGHDHTLQVIETPEWGRNLVSGAGIYGRVNGVRGVGGTVFRDGRAGFMRIDFLRDGRRRLGVVVVHHDGQYEEAFAQFLK